MSSDEQTLSTREWGAKQTPPITDSRVRQLCRAEAIPGAKREGRDWRIPANAPRPLDERRTNG